MRLCCSAVMIARQLSLESNFLSPFLHVISRKRSNSMTETIASSQSTTLFQYIFFFCNHFTICAPTTWLAAQKGRSPTSKSLLKFSTCRRFTRGIELLPGIAATRQYSLPFLQCVPLSTRQHRVPTWPSFYFCLLHHFSLARLGRKQFPSLVVRRLFAFSPWIDNLHHTAPHRDDGDSRVVETEIMKCMMISSLDALLTTPTLSAVFFVNGN